MLTTQSKLKRAFRYIPASMDLLLFFVNFDGAEFDGVLVPSLKFSHLFFESLPLSLLLLFVDGSDGSG